VKGAHKRGAAVSFIEENDIEAQYISSNTKGKDLNPREVEETYQESLYPEDIYRAISEQEWTKIRPISEDKEVMIAQFTALLEHYLQLVIETRQPGRVLSLSVKVQLAKFIMAISDSYGDPHFHQLSHALHVTTSMNKLLLMSNQSTGSSALENFALILAAFLHDAGHTGTFILMYQSTF
jgi:hypothetical protein